MSPRAGLEGCGKSRLTGIQSQDRPARRESRFCVDLVKKNSVPGGNPIPAIWPGFNEITDGLVLML